jgi:ankyrin repeat protein/tRNA A-37 threonylcarbamoyl transferase component Bud32
MVAQIMLQELAPPEIDSSIESNGADKFVRRNLIVAEEDSDPDDDFIPGPTSAHRSVGIMDLSTGLDLSQSIMKGSGMLASRQDLAMPVEEFAFGCKLLQQAALGNKKAMEAILMKRPGYVNFRDYDRRTALHVAASEGHLEICEFLIMKGAKINRSDRWGGSALDDAHRHRHQGVVQFLRDHGATTGSANQSTNIITAAADGDLDEVRLLLTIGNIDLNEGDYDRRTALHLAAGEGHTKIVEILCKAGSNTNAPDRWGGRPLDDAKSGKHTACIKVLEHYGAEKGSHEGEADVSSRRREVANLEVNFREVEMIDRIGAGAFGEIYKCRWRGTLVAAKCIKSATIRKKWLKAQAMESIAKGADVDDAMRELDAAEMTDQDKEAALHDFRQEISVLKSLRHPHIMLLLAYSTTEDHEIMISELMKCSLLDVFKAHIVHGTKLRKKDQIVYATHLAQGMYYLQTCKPPIIHRDLKPANLLIDHSGVLKVADFGLCKLRPDPKTGKSTDTFIMTGETGSYRYTFSEKLSNIVVYCYYSLTKSFQFLIDTWLQKCIATKVIRRRSIPTLTL